jgi:hypothetical protein
MHVRVCVGELPGRRFPAERREESAARRQPRRPVWDEARSVILGRLAADHLGVAAVELAGTEWQAQAPGEVVEPRDLTGSLRSTSVQ